MGYRAVQELLQLPARPTAIFAASDTMAIGGYQAAREFGFSIPTDVASVGYDDISPVALLQPSLTTIRTAYYDFGHLAAELLLDLIDGQKEAPQRVVIQPELVMRESTGVPLDTLRPVQRPRIRSAAFSNQFASRSVAVIGRQGVLTEAITAMLSKDGTSVVTSAWQTMDINEADASICTCDLRRDLEGNLEAALTDGEAAARSMAKRYASVIVLVALVPNRQQNSGIAAAARAGLQQLTTTLATRWAPRGIRVNAVLVTSTEIAGAEGPCQFLLSHASAALSGQVLSLDDLNGT